jgi:hypothetical protein
VAGPEFWNWLMSGVNWRLGNCMGVWKNRLSPPGEVPKPGVANFLAPTVEGVVGTRPDFLRDDASRVGGGVWICEESMGCEAGACEAGRPPFNASNEARLSASGAGEEANRREGETGGNGRAGFGVRRWTWNSGS